MASPKDSFQQALALHQSGRLGEARALYAQVLEAQPRHFDSLHLLGLVRLQEGDLAGGIALIRRALGVRPDVAEAHYNLGHALLTAGEPGAALDSFMMALRINPADAQCHFEAGNALQDMARHDAAIACYDEAIRLDPRFAEAHSNRGIACKDAGRLEEAVASYDVALALRPRYAEAHSNRGNALKEMGRFEEALACHDRAIALKPDYAEAHYNRANALGELKRPDEALASYDAALALRPSYAEARNNKAMLLLGLGRYREGFPLYAARWQTAKFGSEAFKGDVPRWDGSGGEGEVLVWAEQGIGDEILYASLLPLVAADVQVTLAADPRLHAMFRRSFPRMRVVDSAVLKERIDGGYRAQAPVGDLGAILGVDAARLAARPPGFLKPDAGRCAALRSGLRAPGPVVGLSWKSANKSFGAEKSLRLAELAPVLSLPGATFVNLQYGAVAEDIAEVKAALGVEVRQVEGLDVYNDVDGLAALVAACDAVVTTSNITAHLAGAIGQKAVVLVPAGKGLLWYWQGGHNNLWYPSLTRAAQPRIGDWQPAIAAAAAWVRDST